MMKLEIEEYALRKIIEVLCAPWEPGIDYDGLKEAADRHAANIKILKAAEQKQQELIP